MLFGSKNHAREEQDWGLNGTFFPSNFTEHIKILRATFLYKSASRSFSLIAVWLCNFLQKNISAKAFFRFPDLHALKLFVKC